MYYIQHARFVPQANQPPPSLGIFVTTELRLEAPGEGLKKRGPGPWCLAHWKTRGNAVTVKRTVSRYINQTIFLELQTTIFCNGCFN